MGLSFDSWTNETEQRQDFYARLPIKVKARGAWPQIGEFFRQLSELRQIVSVENIVLENTATDQEKGEPGEHPVLEISFEAATYRFLSEEERSRLGKAVFWQKATLDRRHLVEAIEQQLN